MKKITLSEVAKKHLTILVYLLVSGVLGWVLAAYVVNNPTLTAIFAPAINYILFAIKKELDGEGIRAAIK